MLIKFVSFVVHSERLRQGITSLCKPDRNLVLELLLTSATDDRTPNLDDRFHQSLVILDPSSEHECNPTTTLAAANAYSCSR